MKISAVCAALIGSCYFDRKLGYFAPKLCLPQDFDAARYQLMPEYNVAHIRKQYIEYLISSQRYSAQEFAAPEYQIDLSQEFPLIDHVYPQKSPCESDPSKWLCNRAETDEDIESDKIYHDFQNQFQAERGITLFQALTEFAHPLFAAEKQQYNAAHNAWISKAHRFNEDHALEDEYTFFEASFLRTYAILWCMENHYDFVDDM